MPLYGHDMDQGVTPAAAALGWSIPKIRRQGGEREGGFPGAERILSQLNNGDASKLRVGILPSGRAPAREGTEILDTHDNVIGIVTSGGFGPTFGGPIAMGYVKAEYAKTGTDIFLAVRKKKLEAKVADMPFVPQRYYRKPK